MFLTLRYTHLPTFPYARRSLCDSLSLSLSLSLPCSDQRAYSCYLIRGPVWRRHAVCMLTTTRLNWRAPPGSSLSVGPGSVESNWVCLSNGLTVNGPHADGGSMCVCDIIVQMGVRVCVLVGCVWLCRRCVCVCDIASSFPALPSFSS